MTVSAKDKLMTAETTMELMLGLQQSWKPLIWLDYYKLNHTWQLTVLTIFTAWEWLVGAAEINASGMMVESSVHYHSLPTPGRNSRLDFRYPLLLSDCFLVTWTTWLLQIKFLWGKIACMFLVNMTQVMFGIYQNSNKTGGEKMNQSSTWHQHRHSQGLNFSTIDTHKKNMYVLQV